MAKKWDGLTLFDHLEELRKRLFISIITLFIATIIGFTAVDSLRGILTRPAGHLDLIFVSPPEALMANFRLALIAGILISMPVLTYQFLAFIFPALYKNEKKIILPVMAAMLLFFTAGISFAYFTVFPYTIIFFMQFASEGLTAMFTISNYLTFATNFLFAFGVVFQLPILFWFLGWLHIVDAAFLRSQRKYALLFIVVIAAILTPPDVVSQIMMALPLLVLYEIGIILVVISQRLNKKKVIKDEI
ncbi:MAG: twin-arginine translocase subunit TatC [Clostridiales bacterium]|jgi:sec-independent protein translocase protein TatC|nr:twin-arginine translocase subunit TatC [Clostridiales bacterium]